MGKKKISILNISLASGGAEKVISLLLKKLINDYEVTLILFYNNIHFEIPKAVNTIIFSNKSAIKHNNFLNRILSFSTFTFKYLKVLKEYKIDIAISFLAFPNFLNSLASLRFSTLKTIISERGYPSDNTTSKLSYFISKILYPILYNWNDKLFSNSIYINKDLATHFGIKIPMEVIYNPIEIPNQKIKDNQLSKAGSNLKIANVGTLNERKNQELIISAISQLKIGFQLDIYGNGPLKSHLSNLIANYGLGNDIHLKGTVKNVNEHLVNYNCFVLSSNTEGFPNALLEAMAVGLPCISTNCLSGPLELLNGSSDSILIPQGTFYKGKFGLLINNKDCVGLSKALVYYKENPTERIKFGDLAYTKANEFELNVIYKQFKTFINS